MPADRRPGGAVPPRHLHRRAEPEGGHARRSRGGARRALPRRRPPRGADGPDPRAGERHGGRPLRRRRGRPGLRGAVRPAAAADVAVPPRRPAARARADGDRRDTRWPTRRGARSAASPRCSGTSTIPAWTRPSSSASTACPTRTARRRCTRPAACWAAAADAARHARPQAGLAGRTDFRGLDIVTIDGEHARDFDDAICSRAAERALLARRPHRRRVPLRAGGERARRGGVRARHVGVLPGPGGAHVPRGTGDRAVQPEPARGSPGAVVPDGSGPARDRGPARIPRRRHPDAGADDLHRRQRHPHRRRSAARARYRRSCPCSSGCASCSRS